MNLVDYNRFKNDTGIYIKQVWFEFFSNRLYMVFYKKEKLAVSFLNIKYNNIVLDRIFESGETPDLDKFIRWLALIIDKFSARNLFDIETIGQYSLCPSNLLFKPQYREYFKYLVQKEGD